MDIIATLLYSTIFLFILGSIVFAFASWGEVLSEMRIHAGDENWRRSVLCGYGAVASIVIFSVYFFLVKGF